MRPIDPVENTDGRDHRGLSDVTLSVVYSDVNFTHKNWRN